ncbi:MAG: DUF5809 family protein [Halobacteriaceae archaeon]
MERRGLFEPADESEVETQYRELAGAAQTVTREVARTMEMDREEYRERVTGEVVETARDALYASLLRVYVGSREEFEAYCEAHPDLDPRVEGSDHVDNVAFHPAPVAGEVVAVTYQNERDAAVAALRRQAHGTVYRDVLAVGSGDDAADAESE